MDTPKDDKPKSPSFLGRLRSFFPSKKLKSNEHSSEKTKLTSDAEIAMGLNSSETTKEEGSTGEQASGIAAADKVKNVFKSSINKVSDIPMHGRNENLKGYSRISDCDKHKDGSKDKDCDYKTYYSNSGTDDAKEWTPFVDTPEEGRIQLDDEGFIIYPFLFKYSKNSLL